MSDERTREQLEEELAEERRVSLARTQARLRDAVDEEAARGRVEGTETLTGAVSPIDET